MNVFVFIIFLIAVVYYLYTLSHLLKKLAIDGGYGINSAGLIIKFAINPLSIFILYSCFFKLEEIGESKKSFYRNLIYTNILSYLTAIVLLLIFFFGDQA